MKTNFSYISLTVKVMLITMLLTSGFSLTAGAAKNRYGQEIKEPKKEIKQYDWNNWRKRYDSMHGTSKAYLQVKKGKNPSRLSKNALYEEECSSCHFLYQPWLLPARSWQIIINGNDKHFGEDLALEQDSAEEILKYLEANSTENGAKWNKRARKILKSLMEKPPKSIRDVPYIRRKHRKIKAKVFARSSINSFSNCVACHKTAPNGKYDDDNVKIPK